MKGYKGMHKDMTCRGMHFEVGKSYHTDGEIKLCENGFHFCERLSDVFNFYEKDESRYFEILADGVIKSDGKKSVASDMTIIRELSEKEVNRITYGYGYGDGNGDGYGTGDGTGYGYGDGNGYGTGTGTGTGYGYGDDYRTGYNIQTILIFND